MPTIYTSHECHNFRTVQHSLQIACYGAAAAAVAFPRLRGIRVLNLLYFFCVLNAAAAASFIQFAAGRTRKLWARPASDVR
jgi:hypothetical protein